MHYYTIGVLVHSFCKYNKVYFSVFPQIFWLYLIEETISAGAFILNNVVDISFHTIFIMFLAFIINSSLCFDNT